MYGLERRGAPFVLAFAFGCALSGVYGFLSQGVVIRRRRERLMRDRHPPLRAAADSAIEAAGVGILGAESSDPLTLAVMEADGKKWRGGKGSRTRPIVLCEPELVPISDDDERRAVEALIGLLAPLFADTQPEGAGAV